MEAILGFMACVYLIYGLAMATETTDLKDADLMVLAVILWLPILIGKGMIMIAGIISLDRFCSVNNDRQRHSRYSGG